MFIFTIRTINNSVFLYIVILLIVFQLQVNISSAIEPRLSKVPINSDTIKTTINVTKLIITNTTTELPPRLQWRQQFSIDSIEDIKSTNNNTKLAELPTPIIFNNNRTQLLGRALDENNHIESDITTKTTSISPPPLISTSSTSMKMKTTTRDGSPPLKGLISHKTITNDNQKASSTLKQNTGTVIIYLPNTLDHTTSSLSKTDNEESLISNTIDNLSEFHQADDYSVDISPSGYLVESNTFPLKSNDIAQAPLLIFNSNTGSRMGYLPSEPGLSPQKLFGILENSSRVLSAPNTNVSYQANQHADHIWNNNDKIGSHINNLPSTAGRNFDTNIYSRLKRIARDVNNPILPPLSSLQPPLEKIPPQTPSSLPSPPSPLTLPPTPPHQLNQLLKSQPPPLLRSLLQPPTPPPPPQSPLSQPLSPSVLPRSSLPSPQTLSITLPPPPIIPHIQLLNSQPPPLLRSLLQPPALRLPLQSQQTQTASLPPPPPQSPPPQPSQPQPLSQSTLPRPSPPTPIPHKSSSPTSLYAFPPNNNVNSQQKPLDLNLHTGGVSSYLPAASGPIPLQLSESNSESSMLLTIPNLNRFVQTFDQLPDTTKKPYKAPLDLYSFPPNTNVIYQPYLHVDHDWNNNNENVSSSYLPSPAGLVSETIGQSQIKPIDTYKINQKMQAIPPSPPPPPSNQPPIQPPPPSRLPPPSALQLTPASTPPPQNPLPLPSKQPPSTPQPPVPPRSPPHTKSPPTMKYFNGNPEVIYDHPPPGFEVNLFSQDIETYDYPLEYSGYSNFEEYYPPTVNSDESLFSADILSSDIHIPARGYGPNLQYINDYYQNNNYNNGRDRYGRDHLIKKRSIESTLENKTENSSTKVTSRDKKYSYIYLGQKLWYIPLGFTVFFAFYLGYIVIFSAATHKPEVPTNLLFKRSIENQSNNQESVERILNDITEFVLTQIEEYMIKNKL